MRPPVEALTGAGVYKLMAKRPRLPKPWEPDYAECQSFIEWSDAIPESTPRSLLPMIWPLKDRLAYQDGGGLNGFLKEKGLTKPGWKVIAGLSVGETAEAYNYFRARQDSTWVGRLVQPALSVKEVDISASLPLLFTMAEAGISLSGIAAPYLHDWRIMLKALAAEVDGKSLPECVAVSADAIIVRDYFESGDVDVSATATWAEMKGLADQWVAQVAAEDMGEDRQVDVAAGSLALIKPSPGGQDVFTDGPSQMIVVRLMEFENFVAESDLMGHCIGRSRGYFDRHLDGNAAFYSFRIPGVERPVATLELGLSDDTWRICQCRGPSNRDPGPEAHGLADRIREAQQLGGAIRESTIELLTEGMGRTPQSLENTNSRYF